MLKLVIGNKRYSSWSMRPWILMKEFRLPFEEVVIPLYREESKSALLAHSPAGKVPILRDGDTNVWDSLAIVEYLADLYPNLLIWPQDRETRAHARALACEMHSGFAALRSECPMNFGRSPRPASLTEAARADADRIGAAWRDALARYGGPFLFGRFGAADAMFAPVVQRFESYMVSVSDEAQHYMRTIKSLASWKEWSLSARREEWCLPQNERD
ncbi:glutathione S-transferase family protein [Methylocystis sp. SC2]|uniref:glutathione S-transferase family protein n=1 Tax=Methylocystis sp. (strain SC2) TaxID=187303 RepID=UPI00027AF17E|nr:glutathione S-transferase family protein [Methylocystis sp. SC2]CCJ05916.1 Glutathione S-transferase (GST) [Methylocystis sp. SC2]